MTWFLIIISVVNLFSILFLVVTLKRVHSYVQKSFLPESEYTLLFKMVSLRFILVSYAVVIVVHAFATLYLAI